MIDPRCYKKNRHLAVSIFFDVQRQYSSSLKKKSSWLG